MKTPLILSLFLLSGLVSAQTLDVQALRSQAKALHGTIPKTMPGSENDTPAMIALGRDLYFETALSLDGTQSCNTCHRIDGGRGGVDNEKTSLGVKGQRGERNSPSVWNAGFHHAQFWDGRAKDLAEQAKGPILNPVEMAIPDEQAAVDKLQQAGYRARFKEAFQTSPEPLNYDNLALAIAAFERTLITRDRFDAFLEGDDHALNDLELKGFNTFVQSGCASCHNGPLFGGTLYMKMGLIKPYANTHDTGRYAVTQNPADKYVFKVPSLRNVAQTAPYFHDGAANTIEEAVDQMAQLQLGRTLDKQQINEIVAFLQALDNTKAFE